MLKVIRSLTPEAKIKVLEYLSMACIIPMFYFLSTGNLKGNIILLFGASLLQVPIYFLYKSLNQQNIYLKNKAGALAVAGLLVIYLVIKHKFW